MSKVKWILALALVLALVLAAPAMAQSVTRFGTVLAVKLIASNGLTVITGGATVTAGDVDVTTGDINVTAGGITADAGDLTLTAGSAIIGNDLSVADDLTSADLFNTRAATVTVTTDGVITPTGAYQPLSAAGAVQTSDIAGCTVANDGRLVTLINGVNQTITITDTGTLKLASTYAMGQYDSLSLRCDTVNWIEIGRSNN